MSSHKSYGLPLSKLDWVILIILAVFCFLTFQHADMSHTVGSSFAYLKGHIFDFYGYNEQFISSNTYLPSSYVLVAIWNIPLKILGLIDLPTTELSIGIIWWNKILTTLFYIFSGIIIYKIGRTLGFSQKKSKLTAFIWLSTPIALFSQFIFGQYDIFTLFFTLLGLYFYFKKDNFKFILFFGIAITFKYFPIFIFFPLLLTMEKDIWGIIKKTCLVFLPAIIEIAIYYRAPEFRANVLGFYATNVILGAELPLLGTSIKLFISFWVLLCTYAYFNEISDKDDFIKYVFFYCAIACFIIFGISIWHPQWVLFMTPFLVFSTVVNKKAKMFLFLDILLMFFFVAFTVNFWVNNVDQQLFANGIFRYMAKDIQSASFMMCDIFRIHDKDMFYTMFSTLLFAKVIFSHPKFCLDNIKAEIDGSISMTRVRLILGMMIFLIPAFICLLLYAYNFMI